MGEKSVLIQQMKDEAHGRDLSIQFEILIALLGQPELLGLLVSLLFLNQIGFIKYKTQKQIAKLLGFSEPTFIKKRRALEEIGLIEIDAYSAGSVLNLKFLSRLKNFKLPSEPDKQVEYLVRTLDAVYSQDKEDGQLSLSGLKNFKSSSIYIYIVSKLLNNTSNINIKSTSNTKYPKQDYILVLEEYQMCKGVGLQGTERMQALRAIKTMFKSNRKPKDIVAFMRWLKEHSNDPEHRWVRLWTIWTVQKKLPEFLAGALDAPDPEAHFDKA